MSSHLDLRERILLFALCLCCLLASFVKSKGLSVSFEPSLVHLSQSIARVSLSHTHNASEAHPELQLGRTRGSRRDLYHRFQGVQVKHYRPEVFQELRCLAGIPCEDFASLVGRVDFRKISADSKSGQHFYKSGDEAIVLKTISASECRALRRMLDIFLHHVRETEHTCLGNVLGLYRVKNACRKKYVLVTRNIFCPPLRSADCEIAKFDLKGSSVGRTKAKESDVWKDEDVRRSSTRFSLVHPELLLRSLERDLGFLSDLRMMDYSLLVLDQNLRSIHSKSLNLSTLSSNHPSLSFPNHPAIVGSRAPPIFRGSDGLHLYQFGIIDFLQRYTFRKRLENLFKGFIKDRQGISCVPPANYAERLFHFIRECVS